MLIQVIRAFCLRAGVDVVPGDVIEATRSEAMEAISLNRAIEATPDDDEQPAPEVKSGRKWGRK